ncbi:nucleotidyltransferase family protein [Limimaricola cinnabarinus]|uniref:nucleotidyltransferase family protein n=1 Tax=Limimaricola cinnabarinus TaxID=1125964 RepID=UPI002FE17348
MFPLLILAAGAASRMRGPDKLALKIDGVPLLRRQAMAAIAAGARVHVALRPGDPRGALLDGLAVTRLEIAASAEGMGGTLREGVARLPRARRFALMPADLPDLDAAAIARVFDAAAREDGALVWRGASSSGRFGHPVVCDAHLAPRFAMLRGAQGGAAVLAPYKAQTRLVGLPGSIATRDLDTPEDWADWREARGEGG